MIKLYASTLMDIKLYYYTIDINILNSEILKNIIDINFPLGKHKYFS